MNGAMPASHRRRRPLTMKPTIDRGWPGCSRSWTARQLPLHHMGDCMRQALYTSAEMVHQLTAA